MNTALNIIFYALISIAAVGVVIVAMYGVWRATKKDLFKIKH